MGPVDHNLILWTMITPLAASSGPALIALPSKHDFWIPASIVKAFFHRVAAGLPPLNTNKQITELSIHTIANHLIAA